MHISLGIIMNIFKFSRQNVISWAIAPLMLVQHRTNNCATKNQAKACSLLPSGGAVWRTCVATLKAPFFCLLVLISSPGWTQPVQPRSLPLTVASQEEPDFSSTGRPGRQTSGESRSNCPATSLPLTALMPTSNWGKTVSERPTFWFYVPYSPQEAPVGEFVLQDEARQDIYRIPFTLPKTPGFVSFSLPSERSPLAINQWYRWYFKLYCDRQQSSSPTFVQGWVQRVALTPELENQLQEDIIYAAQQVWYDAIAHLARRRLANPTDTQLENNWNRLLKAKGVNIELPNSEPIVGNVN
jgi:hypothetical protein